MWFKCEMGQHQNPQVRKCLLGAWCNKGYEETKASIVCNRLLQSEMLTSKYAISIFISLWLGTLNNGDKIAPLFSLFLTTTCLNKRDNLLFRTVQLDDAIEPNHL